MNEYILHIQNKYDEYLMRTENRGMSYGELHYIQNLSEEELQELEEELEENLREDSIIWESEENE